MHQTRPPSARTSSKNSTAPAASPGRVLQQALRCASRAAAGGHGKRPAAVPRDFLQPAAVCTAGCGRIAVPLPADAPQPHARRGGTVQKAVRLRPCDRKAEGIRCPELQPHSCGTSHLLRSSMARTAPPRSIFCPRRILSAGPRHTMLPGCPPCPDRCAAV